MEKGSSISHQGMVTNLIEDRAVIHILSEEACHTCHMKGFCGVDDAEQGRFEVPADDLEIGDAVSLEVIPSTGLKAVFWAYIMPFLLMVGAVAIGLYLHLSEELSGMIAIGVLPIYYFTLYLFNKQLKTEIRLKVHKLTPA